MIDVVVDASVVLRRLLGASDEAREVLRREGLAAPTVIVAEVLNGLAGAVRFGGAAEETAVGLYHEFRHLPIALIPDEALGDATLVATARLQLSAYDALYITVAAHLRATLVTADRRLAAVYPRSELIA